MKPTKIEYSKMTHEASKAKDSFRNALIAFLVGGAICTLGQILLNIFLNIGLEKKEANATVSICLIGIGAFLTAISVYDKMAAYAGAGTLVPITGFANSIVAPAIEFKSEGQIMGIGAKMFTIAGPVIVFGITTSSIYGLIIWIFKLF